MIHNLIIAILLTLSSLFSQNYKLSILGITFGNLKQENQKESLKLSIKTTDMVDMFLKLDYNYFTTFDSLEHNIKSFKKIIKQDKKITSSAIVDSSNNIIYNKKNRIKLYDNSKNLFSLISMIQEKDYNSVDTKWFNFEHEGNLGKARFLWADSSSVYYNKDSILCDHYRLDIKLDKPIEDIIKNPDIFTSNLIKENTVREFWVSKLPPKKIMAVKIKFNAIPVPVYANLYND